MRVFKASYLCLAAWNVVRAVGGGERRVSPQHARRAASGMPHASRGARAVAGTRRERRARHRVPPRDERLEQRRRVCLGVPGLKQLVRGEGACGGVNVLLPSAGRCFVVHIVSLNLAFSSRHLSL